MKYRITHITRYDYVKTVSLCHNQAHLKLRHQPGQKCFTSQVKVDPTPAVSREFRDFFDNPVSYFAVQQPHHRLTVTAISEVEVNPRALPENTGATRPWEQVRDTAIREALEEGQINRIYALDSAFVKRAPELADYAAASFPAGRPYLESVHDLMRRIYRDFTYDPHFTEIATPLDEVLKHRRGVCQDFAHLAIGCLRSLDLPARYVSGYLETLPPPGKPKLRGADASHAWFAAYVPGEGWLDFDPTNDKMPEDQHITTAVGRDFGDVTPIKGVLYGGGEHSLHVSVDVERLEQRS